MRSASRQNGAQITPHRCALLSPCLCSLALWRAPLRSSRSPPPRSGSLHQRSKSSTATAGHMLHHVRGRLHHAPCIAARTHPAPRTRIRNPKAQATHLTARPRKPVRQNAALQISPHITLYVCRHRVYVIILPSAYQRTGVTTQGLYTVGGMISTPDTSMFLRHFTLLQPRLFEVHEVYSHRL